MEERRWVFRYKRFKFSKNHLKKKNVVAFHVACVNDHDVISGIISHRRDVVREGKKNLTHSPQVIDTSHDYIKYIINNFIIT